MPTIGRIALIVRRVAALPSSQDLTGPSLGDEPCVLKGRCGGTDEFLGRGVLFPQSPWTSVQGGRPLDKCLVQRHADAVWRKLPAAVSEAVKRSPVITTRKEDYSSRVRSAPVDRRGHIRVRQNPFQTCAALRLRRPHCCGDTCCLMKDTVATTTGSSGFVAFHNTVP